MFIKLNFIFTTLLVFSIPSYADYLKTGQAIGTECVGFVAKVCTPHNIDATEKDGKLYEIATVWPSVDEYNPSSGKCTLYPKGNSSNIIAQGIYALKRPTLLEHVGGSYNKVDADYVIFPCIKR